MKWTEKKALEYKREIESWDWEGLKFDALSNDPIGDDMNPDYTYHTTFLGTVFALLPSGKYYTSWTTNQTTKDEVLDSIYWEQLESVAEQHDAWIESGEGDPCDLFACWSADEGHDE